MTATIVAGLHATAAAQAKPAKVTRPRWSAAERAALTGYFTGPARHAPYAVIAVEMATTFGQTFTTASIGSKARALGLVSSRAKVAVAGKGRGADQCAPA